MPMNETKSLRHFGLIMAAGFAVIGAVIPYYKRQIVYPLLILIAGLFFILSLLAPKALKKFREWWMLIGEVLGTINSRILFTFMFLTIFTGIHFLFRCLGRDRFKRKWKAYDTTYVVRTTLTNFSDPF